MNDTRFLVIDEEDEIIAVFALEERADHYIEVMAGLQYYFSKEEIPAEDVYEYI